MAGFTLVIGNRTTSSWSLRGWLALKRTGADFDEIMVWFKRPETRAEIEAHSPSGLVPVLKHGDTVIWETLAIIEYLAELYPGAGLWPEDRAARAHARTISAEMHSGFAPLRSHMPMDLQNEFPGEGIGEGVAGDIKRICEIWQDTRQRFGAGGDFLCGGFSAADIMFAPVVTRFRTYGVDLNPAAQAYADAILDQPLMREWVEGALEEPPPGEVPT